MYRSASTYLYNAVRVLALHDGNEVWGGGRAGFVETDGSEAEVYVVKTHKWLEPLANYSDDIVISYRPVKNAWDSFQRFKPDQDAPWPVTQDWIKWLGEWKRHRRCRYVMEWQDFMDEDGPWVALKDVAHVLGYDHLNLKNVMAHLRSDLAPPSEEQRKDPETLVFHNHYTAHDYEEDIKPRLRVPDRDQ